MTPTPTPEETPTPTPELSDAQANRIKLIRYLRNNGTRDESGNWSVDDKTTRNNGLVMTKVSTDGEFLFFSCGSGMEASDGTIMTSVVTVVCGALDNMRVLRFSLTNPKRIRCMI